MNGFEIPDHFVPLVADFARLGIGELRLKGPDFELVLRAGLPPIYRTSADAGAPGKVAR